MKQRRITEVAALRHILQIKRRLQLEMLASISKLLREHEVNAEDNLLASLVLAVPEELMDDNTSSLGSLRLASNMATKKGARRRPSKAKKSPKPQPGDPDKAPKPQPAPPDQSPKPQVVKPQTPKKKSPRLQPPPQRSPKPQPPKSKKR